MRSLECIEQMRERFSLSIGAALNARAKFGTPTSMLALELLHARQALAWAVGDSNRDPIGFCCETYDEGLQAIVKEAADE